MRYAKIQDGRVANIIIGNPDGTAVPVTRDVQIGWLYDGQTFTPVAQTRRKNRYAWADFLEALTDDELDALLTLRQTSAPLRRALAIIEARGQIDFNNPKPQQFLTFLVNQAVLTAPRALELRG